jgi:RHS repeat-associated protein
LGNIREVWSAAWNYFDTSFPATTAQRTHYYPSGLPWKTTTGIGAEYQKLKYNGKEFVEMHGLDEYDSEARWYYPAIMRTTTPDPHCESYYDISPYAWCAGNPLKFSDLNGMDWFVNNENGNVIFIRGVTELNDELRDKYGLGKYKYENMGNDQMFGKELKEIENREVFTFDGPSLAEKFMKNQGYEKAERVKIEETKTTIADFNENGKIVKETSFDLVEKNKAITYLTSEKLNSKSDMSIKTDGDIQKYFIEFETVRYNLIKPAGQSSYKNAYYEEQRIEKM